MLTLVDRGADILVSSKRIDQALADSLKKEARRRVERRVFRLYRIHHADCEKAGLERQHLTQRTPPGGATVKW